VEPRIGVYICHCGSNIAGTVDTEEVVRFAQGLDSVVVARDYKFMCSEPGQNLIKADITELGLNRVVVASCSPTMHEPTFRRVCQEAGINPYLFQMANIREHCSWVTEDKQLATEKAKALVSAAVRRIYYQEPLEIKEDIRELGLNHVVVASCSPTLHEPTFRRVCQEAGINPYLFQMANIREHCSWVTEDKHLATEKAKALVSAAVRRVYYQQPLETRQVPMNPNTLIVGGGIAGIQAALEIADSEHKVYLVERTPSIGGHMIQFDKTFPTLDCSACILTPKMPLVGQHPYIELLTYSEVEEVSGFIGNFKVKIRKKARYVDEDKCTGCGVCQTKCPWKADSEFDVGMSKRKAIYIPFDQAVPNIPVIDREHCVYFI